MAIYNFDKSQKFTSLDQTVDMRSDQDQLNPQQSQYNHDNPDIGIVERTALEAIRIAGAWVTILPRTDDNKFDPVWNEDASPTYYAGYDLKAYFLPTPPEVLLTKFGHDAPVSMELRFSRAEILNVFGERLIRKGDVIIVPHNSLIVRADRFRIEHVGELGNYRYRWVYLDVACENMNRDETVMPLVE